MSFIPEKDKDFLWWRDGVLYQIYPRSFADSNADGIGDLKGISGKLDYLSKLGVDGIWLSPINPSPDVDFGYDVADYREIDPKFGTLDDFRELVDSAHKRGIHVIMDMVMNHTSDQHKWFEEARKSKDNPYHDYYLWLDGKKGHRPNGWQSTFGGPAWEYVEECGQYYYHMFCKEQPDLNWRNPLVYQEMMDTIKYWCDFGVDGFRLDVFNMYFKDDQYRNNPFKLGVRGFDRQQHIYDCNRPEMMKTVADIHDVVKAYPEHYVIGETFMSTEKTAAMYCDGGKLDGAFNFIYTACKWDAGTFRKAIRNWENTLADKGWPNYTLSNHDVPRMATRVGLGEFDERLKVAAAMTILLRGTPILYYGEEIGMRDIRVTRDILKDPLGKYYWPFHKGRDGCRAPMQWNDQKNSGFSSGEPWLPLNPDYEKRNVNAMIHDPSSILSFYKELIALRKRLISLQKGDLTIIDEKNETVLSFLRKYGNETTLVSLNFSQMPGTVKLDDAAGRWQLKLTNKTDHEPVLKDGKLSLEGEQVVVMGINRK